eukprot:scaffold467_cov366-Pavlova_lutheri.AAC.6
MGNAWTPPRSVQTTPPDPRHPMEMGDRRIPHSTLVLYICLPHQQAPPWSTSQAIRTVDARRSPFQRREPRRGPGIGTRTEEEGGGKDGGEDPYPKRDRVKGRGEWTNPNMEGKEWWMHATSWTKQRRKGPWNAPK